MDEVIKRTLAVLQRAQDQLDYADRTQAREAAIDREDIRTLLALANAALDRIKDQSHEEPK